MKVLIVDDEASIIELINNSVNWKEIGVEEVFTALHGAMALEIYERERPDIVLADIEMPVMDGFGMAEKLSGYGQDAPEIIFLTCHADFSYAQTALRFNAADYILKPFRTEELVGALLKTVIRRRKKKQDSETRRRQEDQVQDSRIFVLGSFIRELLEKDRFENEEKIRLTLKNRGITDYVPDPETRLVYVFYNEKEADNSKLDANETAFIVENMLQETIYQHAGATGLNQHFRKAPFWYNVGLLREQSFDREKLRRSCGGLIAAAKQYLNLNLMCMISEPSEPVRLGAYREELDELMGKISQNTGRVIFLDEKREREAGTADGLDQAFIEKCVRERKKSELFIYMKHFFSDRKEQLASADMRSVHHDLMQVFYGYLYENHINTHDIFLDEQARAVQDSAEYGPLNMIKYVNFMYDYVLRQIDEMKEQETMISRAKQYIRKHYAEDIGRDEISDYVRLAPNYFSSIFRRETGCTLREYVNICRVEEAKRLMSVTDYSITDIALMVGFNNIPYFSTVFKKIMNRTPAEYRAGLRTGA